MIRTRCRCDATAGPVCDCPDRANPERPHGGWQAAPIGGAAPDPPRSFDRTNPRASAITACIVALAMACSGPAASRKRASAAKAGTSGRVTRYRLLLRENQVDPGQAFRCYGQCQDELNPKAYLACLSACPGFEVTQGAACEKYEVPPDAACLTARQIPASAEVPPGLVVLAVIGNVMLVVGAASLCTLSSSHCGTYGAARYPAPR
jgi:hypothetical protein